MVFSSAAVAVAAIHGVGFINGLEIITSTFIVLFSTLLCFLFNLF